MSSDNINKIRTKIDLADKQIIKALALRFDLIRDIANFKKSDTIYDASREVEIMSNIKKQAKTENLDPDFIKNIYKQILKESKKQLKYIWQK